MPLRRGSKSRAAQTWRIANSLNAAGQRMSEIGSWFDVGTFLGDHLLG